MLWLLLDNALSELQQDTIVGPQGSLCFLGLWVTGPCSALWWDTHEEERELPLGKVKLSHQSETKVLPGVLGVERVA